MTTVSFDLRDPASYDRWTDMTLRFSDEDRMGHINNAAYAVYIEAARVAYIMEFLGDDAGALDTVLARLTIDYLQETAFPGSVRIGARLSAVGNKSFTSAYGVFRDGQCLATSVSVNVFFDTRTRTAAAPTAAVRARVEAELHRLDRSESP